MRAETRKVWTFLYYRQEDFRLDECLQESKKDAKRILFAGKALEVFNPARVS